jgi:hypothetical protein
MIKSSRLPLPDLTKVYCVKPHFYETAAEVNIRHRINDSMTSSPSHCAAPGGSKILLWQPGDPLRGGIG